MNAIEANHLIKKFGTVTAVNDVELYRTGEGNLWFPRPQWCGENYHNPDAHRCYSTRWRNRNDPRP